MSSEATERSAALAVRNVGGITETRVELDPGVTVLAGRNATNRTSLLQAIMAALGSDRASLKADAEEGDVELCVDDETYTRRLRRTNGGVAFDGSPYADDPTVADLFAFLLESNEARRAVALGADLHDVIMRPVDTDEIEAEIERLKRERADVSEEIEAIEAREERLPDLERRRRELEAEIDELDAELAEKEAEIESFDADVEQSREERDELEAKLDDLRATRSELDDVRHRIDAEGSSVEALADRRSELVAEREELAGDSDVEVGAIEAELADLRTEIEELDSVVGELNTVIEFNERMLESGHDEVVEALRGDESGGDVTDRLLGDDGHVTCWTCGSEVERRGIEATLDRLRDLRAERLERRAERQERVETLEAEKRTHEERRERRERVADELERIDAERAEREERIAELRDRADELEARVSDLEGTIADLEDDDHDELLERHREANRIEFRLGRRRETLAETTDEIAEIEAAVERKAELAARRDRLDEELADLRTRVEALEREAVTAFNDHMETVLGVLDFGNVERVWIERVEETVRDGRSTTTRTAFELHVVRATEGGSVYEDTVDHLSESEREVTGLVFALAGYLVHDVHEEMPFMLLDSLEAIDSDRIAALVEYLADHVEYLVVALLPEDATAVDDRHARVTDI
jgi:peptidoglycan hydrolase CwlO-like protein